MRIAIIGAGIVGVTTAYELAADGHQVSVFERSGAVADGSSFANAGLLGPGAVATWGQPALRWNPWRQLGSAPSALRATPAAALRHTGWLWRAGRSGRPGRVLDERQRHLHRLARFSQERLDELALRLQLDFERASGCTILLRGARELAAVRSELKRLAELGVPFELVDADRARALEPGLNPATPLRAAVHLPQDGVGNCRQFAHLLKAQAQRLGVEFHFRQAVRALHPGRPLTLELEAGREPFDGAVVCTGCAPLLAGLKLPLQPLWGYTLTAPLRELDHAPEAAPHSALIDARHRVALVRLGRRMRVCGGAELGTRPDRMDSMALAALHRVLDDWFPGAARVAQVQHWKAARPQLADGMPVIGASGREGLWLNLGHGSSGWALAAGSARAIADLLAGRTPAVDLEGLGIARLR